MNPNYKPAFFIVLVFALMAPYLGFVMYFSSRYPSGKWPDWFLYTIAIWFVSNFLVIMLLVKRMSRGLVVDVEKARAAREKSIRSSKRLVVFWILLLLYGLVGTVQGKFPLKRAIPAGVFLLIFIGIFGWDIYRLKRKPDTRF